MECFKKRQFNSIKLKLALIVIVFILSGCQSIKKTNPITDVNNLDNRKIGVMMSWGPDYALSDRDDLSLLRYSRIADMVLALSYGRIDAIAIEEALSKQVLNCVEGVRRVSEPVASDGITAAINIDREDLREEFNEFIKDFQNTDEYKDLYDRTFNKAKYTYKEVELKGGDKTITVGVAYDNYPFTYIDFVSDDYYGIDIEVLSHFANAYGYNIEFVGGTWENIQIMLYYKKLDMAISGISDRYRDDFELTDAALISDIYMPMNIVLIEVEDYEKIKVVGDLENGYGDAY